MGLILEEVVAGSASEGVQIGRMDPTGAAVTSGADVLIFDRIVGVNGMPCALDGFDAIMGLLVASPPTVELTLARPSEGLVPVRWPNGVGVGALAGESLRDVARRAMYAVKYSCEGGSCGTCEMRLACTDDEGEERAPRTVRPCVGPCLSNPRRFAHTLIAPFRRSSGPARCLLRGNAPISMIRRGGV